MANSILSNNPTQLLTKAKVNVTDWTSYVPTTQGFVSPIINEARWRRVGDSMELKINLTTLANAAAEAQVSLPNGLVIDSNKVATTQAASFIIHDINNTNNYNTLITGGDSFINFSSGAAAFTPQNAATLFSANDVLDFTVLIPIQGWSSEAEFLAPLVQPKTAIVYETSTVSIPSLTNSIQTRELNNVSGDSDIVSLNGNQFTLSAGKYRLDYYGLGYQCGYSAVFIFDVTNNQYVSTEKFHVYLGPATDTQVAISDYDFIDISSDTVFELRQYTNLGVGSGLGNAGAFSSTNNPATTNRNSQVKITKLL